MRTIVFLFTLLASSLNYSANHKDFPPECQKLFKLIKSCITTIEQQFDEPEQRDMFNRMSSSLIDDMKKSLEPYKNSKDIKNICTETESAIKEELKRKKLKCY